MCCWNNTGFVHGVWVIWHYLLLNNHLHSCSDEPSGQWIDCPLPAGTSMSSCVSGGLAHTSVPPVQHTSKFLSHHKASIVLQNAPRKCVSRWLYRRLSAIYHLKKMTPSWPIQRIVGPTGSGMSTVWSFDLDDVLLLMISSNLCWCSFCNS